MQNGASRWPEQHLRVGRQIGYVAGQSPPEVVPDLAVCWSDFTSKFVVVAKPKLPTTVVEACRHFQEPNNTFGVENG